jgi:predicted amidohydrolase YtcJ
VFTNGVVFTVNEEQPEAKSVAVSGNKIVFVGPSIEVSSMIGEGRQFLKI